MPNKFGITQIAHWALKVSDVARAVEFYEGRLGFTEMMRLHHADGSLFLIYFRVTDTQFVEIFPGGIGAAAPEEDITAINHICLQVDDIEKTAAALRAAGIALFREPKLGVDGNNQCWIKDPDGNRIEFMQMLPGNLQEAAIAAMNKN
jgi:lactoylglutathione lyase